MPHLNARQRDLLKVLLSEKQYDLLIIGGGVTGAGIALDATTRGLSVALIDKGDFASGTSSRSTKLIHGGLRYLKQLEIGLVREVGRERAVIHRLATHLVRPETMLLPIVKGGSLGRWSTALALSIYEWLAGVPRAYRKCMLDREAALREEPLLPQARLKAGALYYEYRTDDARLTIALMRTAAAHGATCVNYLRAKSFIHRGDRITGVVCQDELCDEEVEIHARVIVSAAGPWVDEVRHLDHSLTGKRLFLSKGVHLVFPHEALPVRHALYFELPDKRMMFVIPRWGKTYVGTTDTPWPHKPDEVRVEASDVQYILDGLAYMFPALRLSPNDIESSWAGVRPLIYEPGKQASEMSRKDEIFQSPSGLISIAGGKLTGYRKMAERVMQLVARRLRKQYGIKVAPCRTAQIPLVGSPFGDETAFVKLQKRVLQKCQELALPPHTATRLATTWGHEALSLLEQVATKKQPSLLAAEVDFCIEEELACSPLDFFERRTSMLFFDLPAVMQMRDEVEQMFAERLAWDQATATRHRQALDRAIAAASSASHVETQ